MTLERDTIDGETTRVRLSPQQLYSIIAAVTIGTTLVVAGLQAIRNDLQHAVAAVKKLEIDRELSYITTNKWRQEKDFLDFQQNLSLTDLQKQMEIQKLRLAR